VIELRKRLEIGQMQDEEYLTVEEVAKQLRVNEKTVRRWINSGILVAIKPQKEYRIAKSELEDFKRRSRTGKKQQS
jgi:excisionase family DNA binding protein